MENRTELVKLLLEHGANPIVTDKSGSNPEHFTDDPYLLNLLDHYATLKSKETQEAVKHLDCKPPERVDNSLGNIALFANAFLELIAVSSL